MSQKLNIAVATFPYGGNGGLKSEHPDSGRYRDAIIYKLAALDDRIGEVFDLEVADTPLHMCRNAMVQAARDEGADVILMIDSDMRPDHELLDGDPEAKPFFETSFDFLYKKWAVGEHVCVFAPYCGGTEDEVVFCCQWRKKSNRPEIEHNVSLELVSREEAVMWTGIAPAAAGPTGLILFAMPMLELIEPTPVRAERIDELIEYRRIGRISDAEFLDAVRPASWFEYEYEDVRHHKKASTEDIYITRDLSMAGWRKYGRDVVFCNWDSWAGHMKPYWVGKPRPLTPETISNKFSDVANRRPGNDKHAYLHQFEPLSDQEKRQSLTDMADHLPENPDSKSTPKPVLLPPKQEAEAGDATFEERVAEEVARKLAEIHQPPTQDEDIGATDTLGKWSDEMLNPQSGQDKPKEIFEDKKVVVKKIEKRVEADVSDQPVINETVISAIRGVAYKKSEVGAVHAAVIGTHTATFAVAIADTIGEGGGRVVCAGDCCEGEGEYATTRKEWLQVVTPSRAGKTVFAIPGDSKEVSDVSEEDYDMIVITECGSSLEFSILLNGWMSRLKESGILLGTNYDPEKYPATCSVLDSMFGSSIVTDGTIWAVNPSLQAQ